MTKKNDLLFELLTEELPPKSLLKLSQAFQANIANYLSDIHLSYQSIESFASPRHLAVLVKQLDEKQPQQNIERRGPALTAAFDAEGNPTKACIGFAKSCATDPKQLETIKTGKGEWVVFRKQAPGKKIFELANDLIEAAFKKLPIPRPMRWGNNDVEFVRPVHSVILMFGEKVIPIEVLGVKASNTTQGHRFLTTKNIKIQYPADYEEILKKHFVIVDFAKRKSNIAKQITKLARTVDGEAIIDDDLLDEVTAIVEWPEGLIANFPEHFLKVPKEALISSIQSHQKCFPIKDNSGNLMPSFITISNIKSKKPEVVIQGNQRVMNARLADAEFFYTTDLKKSLASRVDKLKKVIFQKQLGSMYDKTQRVMKLAVWIAELIGADVKYAERAAYLSKADLLTDIVYEFTELQGVMGYYYALHDNEPEAVALAIREQYMPAYSNAPLPTSKVGQALALADRIDTLVGVFAIGKSPTGDKDPYGLRRAALGGIRIIVENKLNINLLLLLERAKDFYGDVVKDADIIKQALEFIQDRLKTWALDQGFSTNDFVAVAERKVHHPYDFYRRLLAVKEFLKLKEAEGLAAANKRVINLLNKESQTLKNKLVDESLLAEDSEINLFKLIKEKNAKTAVLLESAKYVELLKELSALHAPINDFFDNVMVMVEDDKVRLNRLTLLAKLRELFLQVADISLVQM